MAVIVLFTKQDELHAEMASASVRCPHQLLERPGRTSPHARRFRP
jgi:hypothetical protein